MLSRQDATYILDTLIDIACFGDEAASTYLRKIGSFAYFDEPGSVRAARHALKKIGYIHESR